MNCRFPIVNWQSKIENNLNTITLKYFVPASGGSGGNEYVRSFPLLALRGVDDPDEIRIVGQQYSDPAGVLSEQIIGFKRIMTLDFGVVQSFDDRKFLHAFLSSEPRRIAYSLGVGEEWYVELYEPEQFSNEWLDGFSLGRRFVLRLIDKGVLQVFPVGQGYGYDYGGAAGGYGSVL